MRIPFLSFLSFPHDLPHPIFCHHQFQESFLMCPLLSLKSLLSHPCSCLSLVLCFFLSDPPLIGFSAAIFSWLQLSVQNMISCTASLFCLHPFSCYASCLILPPTFLSCLLPSVCTFSSSDAVVPFVFSQTLPHVAARSLHPIMSVTPWLKPIADFMHFMYTYGGTHTPSCYQPLVFVWICPVFYLNRTCASSFLSSLRLLIKPLFTFALSFQLLSIFPHPSLHYNDTSYMLPLIIIHTSRWPNEFRPGMNLLSIQPFFLVCLMTEIIKIVPLIKNSFYFLHVWLFLLLLLFLPLRISIMLMHVFLLVFVSAA